jgi:hypothetical protein
MKFKSFVKPNGEVVAINPDNVASVEPYNDVVTMVSFVGEDIVYLDGSFEEIVKVMNDPEA